MKRGEISRKISFSFQIIKEKLIFCKTVYYSNIFASEQSNFTVPYLSPYYDLYTGIFADSQNQHIQELSCTRLYLLFQIFTHQNCFT